MLLRCLRGEWMTAYRSMATSLLTSVNEVLFCFGACSKCFGLQVTDYLTVAKLIKVCFSHMSESLEECHSLTMSRPASQWCFGALLVRKWLYSSNISIFNVGGRGKGKKTFLPALAEKQEFSQQTSILSHWPPWAARKAGKTKPLW